MPRRYLRLPAIIGAVAFFIASFIPSLLGFCLMVIAGLCLGAWAARTGAKKGNVTSMRQAAIEGGIAAWLAAGGFVFLSAVMLLIDDDVLLALEDSEIKANGFAVISILFFCSTFFFFFIGVFGGLFMSAYMDFEEPLSASGRTQAE